MKDKLIITGGKKLQGTIKPQGAKNEAFQVLAGALLTTEDVVFENVPNILDVQNMFELFKYLGVSVQKKEEGTFVVNAKNLNPEKMKDEEFQKKFSELRGSLVMAGAILSRFGVSYMPEPGGDKIGVRPTTVHTRGFQDLGALFNSETGEIIHNEIISKQITLREASVTGTANIILASILKKNGQNHTVSIYNAACEPYIQQLCKMLVSMGASISGAGTNLITISGVDTLLGTTHRLLPDMIEIGSLICLATVAGNGILIQDAKKEHLGEITSYIFEKLGVSLEEREDGLFVPSHQQIVIKRPSTKSKRIRVVYDDRWPGLSPDQLSSMIVLATQSDGIVTFRQRMFDRRLLFCDTLVSMGADIVMSHHQEVTVVGNGRAPLYSYNMASPDIRAGMALVIAALTAQGTSVIRNVNQIHRGYENIVERLRALGADIEETD